MRQLTLSLPEKDYAFFLKVIKQFGFVKLEKSEKINSKKQIFLDELKEAVEEINLIKQGKLKGRPLEELLNEL